jgi:hypothetical protein
MDLGKKYNTRITKSFFISRMLSDSSAGEEDLDCSFDDDFDDKDFVVNKHEAEDSSDEEESDSNASGMKNLMRTVFKGRGKTTYTFSVTLR